MSNGSSASDTSHEGQSVSNPASDCMISLIALYLLIVAFTLFYVLIATWPVLVDQTDAKLVPLLAPDGKTVLKKFEDFHVFWLGACNWAPDKRMMFTVVIAGAVGSLAHTLPSFADFVGNRRFSANWMWWYVLRLPIGAALAIFFYFMIRGGILVPTLQSSTPENLQSATLLLNPYGIAAFAALAGMFSKQATDKLGEIFDAAFARKNPVKRDDSLTGNATLKFDPPKLTKGKSEVLSVTGTGFLQGCEATVGGKPRKPEWVSETKIKIPTAEEDVAQARTLEVVVKNPNNGATFTGKIEVVDPAAAKPEPAKPTISGPATIAVTKDDTAPLTINGTGFQDGCKALVDGADRPTERAGETQVKVLLSKDDVATAGKKLQLVIKNPGDKGQSSAPVAIEIK